MGVTLHYYLGLGKEHVSSFTKYASCLSNSFAKLDFAFIKKFIKLLA